MNVQAKTSYKVKGHIPLKRSPQECHYHQGQGHLLEELLCQGHLSCESRPTQIPGRFPVAALQSL